MTDTATEGCSSMYTRSVILRHLRSIGLCEMPKPRALGNVASAVVGTVTERLAQNHQNLFDAVVLIYAGDKEAAVEALKPIAANNALALQVLTLLRAGETQAAEELLIDTRIVRPTP